MLRDVLDAPKTTMTLIVLATSAIMASSAWAQSFPRVAPESVGFSS